MFKQEYDRTKILGAKIIRDPFGNSKEEAFNNIKLAIVSLLNAAENNNIEEIRKNPLSNLLKGKILSTYYLEKFLNVFADKHLEYFLDQLDIFQKHF